MKFDTPFSVPSYYAQYFLSLFRCRIVISLFKINIEYTFITEV